MYYFNRETKYLALLILSVLLVNCTNEKDYDVVKKAEPKYAVVKRARAITERTNHLSYEEALSIAMNSISMVDGKSGMTRGKSNRRVINEKNGVFTIGSKSDVTRSGDYVEDTLLYVFNFNDNQGFAVVSANRNTESLLAVTESGSYQPDTESEIDGLNGFMKMAKEYVKNAKNTLIKTSDSYNYWKVESDTLEYSRLEAKIPVAWGQDGVAGTYCSNNTAGCGPIVMAQIMSYYQHPNSFTFTFGNRDINYETVNWSQINQHVHTGSHPYPLCNGNSNLDKTIGRICRELGCKARSTYKSNGATSTSPGALYDVLTYYGYTMPGFHSIPSDENSFMDWLVEDKLIIMVGYKQNDIGHFWLIDGGFHIKTHSVVYASQDEVNWVSYHDWTINQTYSHINWGWDGFCNGLFLYNVFNANSASEYDNGSSYNNHTDDDVNFYRGVKYSLVYY